MLEQFVQLFWLLILNGFETFLQVGGKVRLQFAQVFSLVAHFAKVVVDEVFQVLTFLVR